MKQCLNKLKRKGNKPMARNYEDKEWMEGDRWTPKQLLELEKRQADMLTAAIHGQEADPNGKSAHDHGSKLDAGKPDCSLLLLFGRALTEVAEVGTFGAAKYTRGGWIGVPDGINRYTAALMRHVLKEQREKLDSDSGLLHAAHAAWNALARLEMILIDIENEHAAWERGY
jgi:hypothetical protein